MERSLKERERPGRSERERMWCPTLVHWQSLVIWIGWHKSRVSLGSLSLLYLGNGVLPHCPGITWILGELGHPLELGAEYINIIISLWLKSKCVPSCPTAVLLLGGGRRWNRGRHLPSQLTQELSATTTKKQRRFPRVNHNLQTMGRQMTSNHFTNF